MVQEKKRRGERRGRDGQKRNCSGQKTAHCAIRTLVTVALFLTCLTPAVDVQKTQSKSPFTLFLSRVLAQDQA